MASRARNLAKLINKPLINSVDSDQYYDSDATVAVINQQKFTDLHADNFKVDTKIELNGAGSQYFAYNEDTVKVKFANWYSSNTRQYGQGQLWFEQWFAAVDSADTSDNRRIGFYLDLPDKGASDAAGGTGAHPTNSKMHIDINGVTIADALTVGGDVTAPNIFDSDQVVAIVQENQSSFSAPSFLVFGQATNLTNQTTAFEMKTTNGAQNGQGWRMPLGGTVTHVTAQMDCNTAAGNMIFELYKNGTATGKTLTVSLSTGDVGGVADITDEDFSAGDRLTVFCRHSTTGADTDSHAVTLRILLDAVS